MVAGEGEDLSGGEGSFAGAIANDYLAGLDADDLGVEVGADFVGGDAIFDVGLDPVFEAFAERGAAMDERDAGAGAEEFEGGLGGRILCADDDDVLLPVGMRIGEIVRDVREIFAGNVHEIGAIVIASGEDDFAGCVVLRISIGIASADTECAIAAGDGLDGFVEAQFEGVVIGGAAIVFEGFGARGFCFRGGERKIADFEAFGGGEEDHVGRVVIDGIAEAALVDDEGAEACAFGFDGAGEAGGSGADGEEVVGRGVGFGLGS